MKTLMAADEYEYASLPFQVQRKYFSTLERLRLAQTSDGVQRNKSRHGLHSKLSSSGGRAGTKTSIEFRRPSTTETSPRRLRKNSTREYNFTHAEAQWFLSLPDAIRRKQFSREEQILLASLCESVALDPVDEAFYKFSQQVGPDRRTVSSSIASSLQSRSSDDISTKYMMEDQLRDTFRWMDDEDDLDLSLTLEDYHATFTPEPSATPKQSMSRSRRPSFKRTLSLTNFGRISTSSNHPSTPVSTSTTAQQQRKAPMPSINRHVQKSSVSSINPNAAHYQDPEARLKLRVYLASPQKFDEAIEFGFPSTDGPNKENNMPAKLSIEPVRQSTSDDTGHTFLNDDSGSLFDDPDDISVTESDSPMTPHEVDATFRPANPPPTSSAPNSMDSYKSAVRQRIDSYSHAPAAGREMTLRMTLTRPDLRADETALYGWQAKAFPKEDPLALEDLPFSQRDHNAVQGITTNTTVMPGPFGGPDGWGPLPKDNSIVKKFWRKVKTGHKST